MAAQQNIQSTTQKFLDIYDVASNLVVLKDGSASFVLSVSAMNFGLLAEQEQDAVIYTYAALLNSINYPIQIVIQSQTKDVTKYLNLLKEQEQKASSEKKSKMIARYRGFVSQLIKERNVLDKKFYVVASATAMELGLFTPEGFIPGKNQFDITKYEKTVILEKAQSVLEPRRDHLISQFARIGLFARQLATQEIIKIFYTNYNPEASEGLEIANTDEYTTPLVRANLVRKRAAQAQKQPVTNKQNFTEYYQKQNSSNMQQNQQNTSAQTGQAVSTKKTLQPKNQQTSHNQQAGDPTPLQNQQSTQKNQQIKTPGLKQKASDQAPTNTPQPTPSIKSSKGSVQAPLNPVPKPNKNDLAEDISSFSTPADSVKPGQPSPSAQQAKPANPTQPSPSTQQAKPASPTLPSAKP
ncbi:MAG: hypothetical protein U9O78_01610, partial [Patescibacteria group bacterium]|nr:hypothetical protein [Patescibacteria group bacterium]